MAERRVVIEGCETLARLLTVARRCEAKQSIRRGGQLGKRLVML